MANEGKFRGNLGGGLWQLSLNTRSPKHILWAAGKSQGPCHIGFEVFNVPVRLCKDWKRDYCNYSGFRVKVTRA